MGTEYNNIATTKVANVTTSEVDVVTQNTKQRKPVAQAIPVKKSLVSRLFTAMFGPEKMSSLKERLIYEIIFPAIRDATTSTLHTTVDTVFGGGSRNTGAWNQPTKVVSNNGRNRTNYNNIRKAKDNYAPVENMQGIGIYVLPDRNQALEVLNNMNDDLNRFGQVSVADYYDYIGVETTYNDQTIGWTDLSTVRVVATRGGYMLDLPHPDAL